MPTDEPSDRQHPDPGPLLERTDDRLAALESTPVDEHVAIFEAVHADLRATLAGTDPRPDLSDGLESGRQPPRG